MSGRGAIATRRQVRKAFGGDATRMVFEHEQAVRALIAEDVIDDWVSDRHGERLTDLENLRRRGFLGRLKWLFTGR